MEDQGKRILLFVVLAAAIFIVFQWVSPKPEKDKPADTSGATGTPSTPASEFESRVGKPVAGAEKSPTATPSAPPVVAEEKTEVLGSKAAGLEVTFSNLGGVVKHVRRGFDPFKGRDMDEDLFVGGGPGQGLVATNFMQGSTHLIPVGAAWTGELLKGKEPCGEADRASCDGIRYTYRDDVLEIVKSFTLLPADYLVLVHVEVRAVSGEVNQQLALSMYSTGDGITAPVWKPACHVGTAGSIAPSKLAGKPPREQRGRVRFVGLARKYELIALSPRNENRVDWSCNRASLDGVSLRSQVDLVYESVRFSAADKGSVAKDLVMYVGPKYFDSLEGADQIAGWSTGFKSVIDLGWFSFIARPMLWVLHKLFEVFGNWGVAIILLTFLVKLATLYWTTKSMRSMKAMAALKPEMEAIQKRFPDDRTKQQQAQMALFKQHGVSPLAGCLPMLLQMPIWIALYRMLSSAGELHQATFIPGWLDDLTQADPYFILPLTLTGMMFLQSRLQPATGDSAQQKILMYGMPLMFGGMSLFFPSGLTVYIFTNTVLGILHSLWMNRTTPAALAKQRAAAAARAAAAPSESPKVPREARQAKRFEAEVADASDDDDGDDGERGASNGVRRPDGNSKGGASGGSRKRGQRRGKRRG